ncbi:MAG: NADH:ubiquinone reductase (Na(+)-transporting) subunit C [Bacteroidales bacterium]|nr:NADH:ubiquinone reductase (Na(+)-transporting) subunit C [Bacteroidales bacterium]
MFSNRYIFIYSSILIIIVGIMLALASSGLQPFQQANIKTEKIQYILNSAHIENNKQNAEKIYKSHLIAEYLVDNNGNIVSTYNYKNKTSEIIPFEVNIKEAYKTYHEKGKSQLPVFVLKKNQDTIYVLPMYGLGLWGPIWGYMALKSDFETIEGAVFDHKGETPGLGAEISTPVFQAQFSGKKIFKNNDLRPVRLVKGGKNNPQFDPFHDVDAISGGTITSNGTTDMIEKALKFFEPFLEKNRKKYHHENQ